ncbi:MAG TPA: metallophosphoesterase [Flavisolibacter sp.]
MIQWFRQRLFRAVVWLSNKFASRPEKDRVFEGLSKMMRGIENGKESKGIVIPFSDNDRFIIFSDQHKGAKNGADDFMLCEPNYLAALDYYYDNKFQLIVLGDCEELWENRLSKVMSQQEPSFNRYRKFAAENRFFKTVGNHDLDWKNDPWTMTQIKKQFGVDLTIYDGVLLQTTIGNRDLKILCTHGHQGDLASDGNWFSKFFVSKIWAPMQAWLKINPNTPAYDAQLKTLHNRLMYEWSEGQKNLLLITGHTHQPVFESLTYIERLYRQLQIAEQMDDDTMLELIREEIKKRRFEYNHVSHDYLVMKPTYFNSGCCCFNDGDITGIEIENGYLRLIKWSAKGNVSKRQVLEEEKLAFLLQAIS